MGHARSGACPARGKLLTKGAMDMKRFLMLMCAAALLFALLAGPANAVGLPRTDFLAEMCAAVTAGDYAAGETAAAKRAEKIEIFELPYAQIDFEELWLLSKIIYAEAGSYWLPMDWKMAVGEVVLNRVSSPEFPDTMREVLEQPGQYYGKNNPYFDCLRPSAECVEAARRLLSGERVLGEPGVVFQSNFHQGSGVYLEMRDQLLGSTYFCWSIRPELYQI
jgi:hypothetical protein